MCSKGSARQATTTAAKSLSRSVTIDPSMGQKAYNAKLEEEKAKMQQTVDVEDRGQFQFDTKGEMIKPKWLEDDLASKTSKLYVSTGRPHTGGNPVKPTEHVIPAKLRIKRRWSVSGGGVTIPKMNADLESDTPSWEIAGRPRPNVRSVGGQIFFM